MILIGFGVGILSGAFGIGGGFLLVPFLYYYKFDNMQTAVGTTLVAMFGAVVMGAIRHHYYKNINWPVALTLMVGLALGAIIGAWINENSSSKDLARFLGIILTIAGIKLVIDP